MHQIMPTNAMEAEESNARVSKVKASWSKKAGTIAKRAIKLGIALCFYCGSRLRRGLQIMLGREPAGTCVVLYYHAVPAHLRGRFAKQMDVLTRCATPIRADHQEALAPGRHHVVITFHDAFVSVKDNAVPELMKRKIPSTIFVPTGYLGQHPGWIKDETHSDFGETVLDANGLKSLDREYVLLESHTVHHPSLPKLDESEAREELVKSKVELESILERSVDLLAFPYGDYNDKIVDWSKQAGYQRVFAIQPNVAFSNPKEFVTGSCSVSPGDWNLEFKMKLMGAYSWLVPLMKFVRRTGRARGRELLPVEQSRQENI